MENAIDGVKLIDLPTSSDERGSFFKLYSESLMTVLGLDFKIAQVNVSRTDQVGTIRGLHFQKPPYSEAKLIRCVRGKIFDVVVDLRSNSRTFLKYQSFELTESCHQVLNVPAGCAHGFQVLEASAEVVYAHSQEYMVSHEDGINPFDSKIGISWPVSEVRLSPRDESSAYLPDGYRGLEVSLEFLKDKSELNDV
jgi:dTDP-4-dehydrorhamnose 3,5-epimerase